MAAAWAVLTALSTAQATRTPNNTLFFVGVAAELLGSGSNDWGEGLVPIGWRELEERHLIIGEVIHVWTSVGRQN